jgi:ribosomal protein S18 acetylase RimI-like enzyme
MIIRRATMDDAQAVLDWRNDPVAVSMSKSGAVDSDGHVQWFAKAIADPARDIFIAEEHGERVGMVRFDQTDDNYMVSICVAPAARGRGVGSAMLERAMAAHRRPYVAEIMPENTASLRIFQRCGFRYLMAEQGFIRMVTA